MMTTTYTFLRSTLLRCSASSLIPRLLCVLVFLLSALSASAAVGVVSPAATEAVVPTQAGALSAAELTREAVEAKVGRKLKLKERIALSVMRGKVKRQQRRAARGKVARGGPVDGLAVASLVCGILGLILFFPAIPALVLGIISLGRFNRDPQYRTGKGMAIAGIVLGGLVTFLFLLIVGILIIAGGF